MLEKNYSMILELLETKVGREITNIFINEYNNHIEEFNKMDEERETKELYEFFYDFIEVYFINPHEYYINSEENINTFLKEKQVIIGGDSEGNDNTSIRSEINHKEVVVQSEELEKIKSEKFEKEVSQLKEGLKELRGLLNGI